MTEHLGDAALIMGSIGAVMTGAAAIIRAWFNGRATLIRAQRGDPEASGQRVSPPTRSRSILRRWRADKL